MRHLAIIPAQGTDSKPYLKEFLGKPIIAHAIETAIKAGLFDEIMVSTPHEEIAEIARFFHANVPINSQPNFSSSTPPLSEILTEVLNYYKTRGVNFKYACCLQPAAFFIDTAQLEEAYWKMRKSKLDCVMPVSTYNYPVQKALKMNNQKVKMMQPQYEEKLNEDLETYYFDCEQFYWFNTQKFRENKSLLTRNTGAIIIPAVDMRPSQQPMLQME